MKSLEGVHSQENSALDAMATVSHGSERQGEEEKQRTWLELAEEEVRVVAPN